MRGSKTSLLVGATGFIGTNLSNYLASKGERVIGTYYHRLRPSERQSFHRKVLLLRCDVTRSQNMERIIRRFRPAEIYYLAAQSSVRRAWLRPVETLEVNFLGGVYLLEALRRSRSRARLLIFSSGTTYGASHSSGKRLNEEACLKPKDPYSVSKMGIDFFSRLYAQTYGMSVSVVRLANLVGPGQSTLFSLSNFAAQIVKLESNGQSNTLRVGNLSAERDYLDIRDGILALYLAMKKGKPGEAYNIASGTSRTLKNVLKEMIALSSLKRADVRIKKSKGLIPKDEIAHIRLDPSKFKRLTGWKPKIPFRQTLSDLLDHWRNKVNQF